MRTMCSQERGRLHATLGGVTVGLVTLLGVLGGSIAPGVATGSAVHDKATATVAPAPGRCIEAVYEGTLELEGHYARPGDTRRYRSRQRFLLGADGAARLDWSTWSAGDSAGPPESWLLRDGRVLKRSAPGEPWRQMGGDRAEVERLQVLAGLPWL